MSNAVQACERMGVLGAMPKRIAISGSAETEFRDSQAEVQSTPKSWRKIRKIDCPWPVSGKSAAESVGA